MFEKIIVAVDGSDASDRAVQAACDLASRYGSSLNFVHVMEEVGSSRVPADLEGYAKLEHVEVSERNMLEGVASQIVARAETRALEAKLTDYHGEIRVGDPGRMIAEYAKTVEADLIIMGRRGLGRITELLLGGVSHRVTQLSTCSCLTIA